MCDEQTRNSLQTMDLLQSFLNTCAAEKYIDMFRNEGIEVHNMSILNDEDLQRLGIEEEKVRDAIRSHSKALTIPMESLSDVNVNNAYIAKVLQHQNDVLDIYNASFACGTLRKDIRNVDIDVRAGSESLMSVLDDLSRQIEQLRTHLKRKEVALSASKVNRQSVLLTAFLAITSIFLIKHYL